MSQTDLKIWKYIKVGYEDILGRLLIYFRSVEGHSMKKEYTIWQKK